MNGVDDEEAGGADGAEEGEGCDTPQDKSQVEVIRDLAVAVRFGNGHGEHGVGDEPDDDHVCAHGAVVVLLLLRFRHGFLGDFDAVAQVAQGFVVA